MQVTIFVECHENNSRIQYPYISNGNIFQFLPSQSLSEQVKFDD